MKYKVTNKLEQQVNLGKIVFGPKETKELSFAPYSDKLIVEKMKSEEKPIQSQGGKK